MGLNYKIKQKKEDFIVDEVSLRPEFYPFQKSDFSYLLILKIGMTTFDALEEIKKAFHLTHGDVSAQGLKDEDGVTSQLISIRKIIFPKDIKLFNKKFTKNGYKLQIKKIEGYGNEIFVPRLLHGNNFKLTIRNLNKNIAESFYNYCQQNRFISFINYYDNQRFGMVEGPFNTHLIGEAIIKTDWVKAFRELKKTNNIEPGKIKRTAKINHAYCKNFFKELNFSKLSFFISSYNSHIWNNSASKHLSEEIAEISNHSFPEIGSLSLPKENTFKLANLFTVDAYDINKDTYEAYKKPFTRNLIVTTTVFPARIEKDELNINKYCARASFFPADRLLCNNVNKTNFYKN